jgi:hypothetical protein
MAGNGNETGVNFNTKIIKCQIIDDTDANHFHTRVEKLFAKRGADILMRKRLETY